ncbi:MAG: hypothetical protein AB1646_02080 [Thermodesulfobacteriota bacterium]
MTTLLEQGSQATFPLEENRTGQASCHKTVDTAQMERESAGPRPSTRVLMPEYQVTSLVITTHRDRISFPLDIKREIRRVANLLANNVRPITETKPHDQEPAAMTCPFEIR